MLLQYTKEGEKIIERLTCMTIAQETRKDGKNFYDNKPLIKSKSRVSVIPQITGNIPSPNFLLQFICKRGVDISTKYFNGIS